MFYLGIPYWHISLRLILSLIKTISILVLGLSLSSCSVSGSINELADFNSGKTSSPLKIAVPPISLTEGDGFTVAFVTSSNVESDLILDWSITGTGAAMDFTAVSGAVTVSKGTNQGSFTLSSVENLIYDGNRGYNLKITPRDLTRMQESSAIVTVIDDEATPVLQFSAGSSSINESAGTATLTVTSSVAGAQAMLVNYTVTGTASGAGVDYTLVAGTVTLPALSTSASITVPIIDDVLVESSETVIVTLGAVTSSYGTVGATNVHTLTIIDNEVSQLSIDNVTANEGGSLSFTVTLSPAASSTVTVDWSTANDTAISGTHYTAGSGTLTFTTGQTSKTVTVNSIDNSAVCETDKLFRVNLSNATAASIAATQGTGTIADPDVPSISVANASATEGSTINVTASLSAICSSKNVSFSWTTSDGTAITASDYTAVAPTTATINAGQTSVALPITTTQDSLDEVDETMTVTISSPTDGTIGTATATATITDDDTTPTLAIDTPAAAVEGSNVTFTVTLSAASGQTVTVNYASSSGTATSGTDFTAASGTLTFTAGQTSKTISVATTADAAVESSEVFTVTLSSPSNATIATAAGTGTITDSGPVISAISAQTTNEDVPKAVTFTISDPDTSVACNTTYLSMSSADTNLVANANVVFSGTAPNCTATISPVLAQYGGVALTITLTDGNTSRSSAFNLTVNQVADIAMAWHFDIGTAASYTLSNPAVMDFSGGIVRLKDASATDSTNAVGEFGSGAGNGVVWDSGNSKLKLGANTLSYLNIPQATNLVSYWKMDGDWVDEKGSYTGSAQNGATFTASSRIGSGTGSFDGIDDYVQLHNSFLASHMASGTLSLWVSSSVTNLSGEQGIYDESDGTGTNWRIGRYNNRLFFGVYRDSISSWTDLDSADLSWGPGIWHHVAVSWTATSIKLYVNGFLAASATAIGSTDRNPLNAWFGRYGQAGYYFQGQIDEVGIWATDLSENEIKQLSSECSGLVGNCSELSSDWTPQWASLAGYWKMNEVSGSAVIADSSGNANTGSIGAGITTGTTGKINRGINFGAGAPKVTITSSASLQPATEITVSLWAKADDWYSNAWQGLVLKPSGVDQECYNFDITPSNNLRFGNYQSSTSIGVQASHTLKNGEWAHLVGVMSLTDENAKIYINGVLAGTGSFSSPATFAYDGSPLYFGWQKGASAYFRGDLDDVAIWGKALTAAEVKQIYDRQSTKYGGQFLSRVYDAGSSSAWNDLRWTSTLPFGKELPDYVGAIKNENAANYSSLVGSTGTVGDNDLMSGIVGLWHLNETSGTTVVDSSGGLNHGATNSVSLGADGRFGNSTSFNGTSSYVSVPYNSSFDSNTFTVSAWVNVPSTIANASYATLISRRADWAQTSYEIHISNIGMLNCFSHTAGGVAVGPGIGTTDLRGKGWSHVLVKYDGTTYFLYVNGILESSNTGAAHTTSQGLPTINFGRDQFDGAASLFKGQIDEVAIWNRALHANEVQQLYQRGASRLKFQVRSCAQSDCSDGSWKGPDGTSATYFSELNNNTIPLTSTGLVKPNSPNLSLSDFTSPPSNARYFQYNAIFESDSSAATLGPDLKTISVVPSVFTTGASIIGDNGFNFSALTSFTEKIGSSCSSGITYNLSLDKSNWYWWDASAAAGVGAWVLADGSPAKSNSAITVHAHRSTFGTQVGSGTMYMKAYLNSTGTSPCEFDQVSVIGKP